jgi:bifunctional NMN adenylyltransferase/nudix hydrolase
LTSPGARKEFAAMKKILTPDLAVFIGRFQPFHLGHERVVRAGLEQAQHVLVLIGSSNRARSTRDPWTFEEREQMLRAAFSAEDNARLVTAPLPDEPYREQAWLEHVQSAVQSALAETRPGGSEKTVALLGYAKDHSSYYLKLFPQWTALSVPALQVLNATDVRKALFANALDEVENSLSPAVFQTLKQFAKGAVFRALADEEAYIAQYKQAWAHSPHPPTFLTGDAVVTQSGHVLLVERTAKPGTGQWALPGGFIAPHERIVDGCVRKLKEETGIKVPEPALRGAIRTSRVFDDPYRSTRGRTVTHAFHFALRPELELPKLRAGTGARTVAWVPLSNIDPRELFEDHAFIIRSMVSI